MANSDNIDPKFFNRVAQIAHVATMYALAFSMGVFLGFWGLIGAAAGGVAYASWHEFVWDPKEENAATRGSDLEDFLFLLSGLALGIVSYLCAHWLGRL